VLHGCGKGETVRGRLGGLGGDGALILAAVFLGLNYAAIKVAVVSVPPLLIGAFRFVLGWLLLLGVLRLVENAGRPKPGALLVMLGIGLVGGTLFNAALNEGMSLTSASNSALIMATAPIWGMFLAAALGVETLNIRSLLGAGISLLGVGLILGKGLDGSASSLLGDVLVLVAAISFGAYSVLSRREQANHSPLTIAAYTTLLGGLALFPLATTELASWNVRAVSLGAWAAVGYLTVFSTAFAYGVWQHGIARIGPSKVLVYLYLITLTGVLSSVVLLHEDFGLRRVIGAIVLLAGVYLSRRG
jgi:drug/metabolite transporter (DMT)-like permease